MRAPRLPPLDTSGYISYPINTPLLDLDQKSPLPCIIVTPASPTEYHIAFHHKSSPLTHSSFAAQQQQQWRVQARPRRAYLHTLNPFVTTASPVATAFDVAPPRRIFCELRTRPALVLVIPILIIVCHILASLFLRNTDLRGPLFGGGIIRGGFSSAAAHMRAQRGLKLPAESPASDPSSLD